MQYVFQRVHYALQFSLVFVFSSSAFDLPAQAQSSQKTDLNLFYNSHSYSSQYVVFQSKKIVQESLSAWKEGIVQNMLYGFCFFIIYKKILHFDSEEKKQQEIRELENWKEKFHPTYLKMMEKKITFIKLIGNVETSTSEFTA